MDLSHVPDIRILLCHYNGIKKIDLSSYKNLSYIEISHNPLEEIIVSSSSSVVYLGLAYVNLKRLPDLSRFPKLKALDYRGNILHDDDRKILEQLQKRFGFLSYDENGYRGVLFDDEDKPDNKD